MTTVLQSPQPPVTPAEAAVACAIFCCDQQDYSLNDTSGGEKTCQRLANRKHSCVVHKLREEKGGKMTTTNKVPGVQASPRFDPKDTGVPRTLIPDTIVDGNKIIDAKFPCKTGDVHGPGDNPPGTGPGFTKPGTRRAFPSDARTGVDMGTPKEATDYTNIKGVQKVECMTPEDAKSKKDANCKC
jgi:hypothetical protein